MAHAIRCNTCGTVLQSVTGSESRFYQVWDEAEWIDCDWQGNDIYKYSILAECDIHADEAEMLHAGAAGELDSIAEFFELHELEGI